VLLGEHFPHFVSHRHATNAGAHDDDMSHDLSPAVCLS
jgi:hypothetical protein